MVEVIGIRADVVQFGEDTKLLQGSFKVLGDFSNHQFYLNFGIKVDNQFNVKEIYHLSTTHNDENIASTIGKKQLEILKESIKKNRVRILSGGF